MSLMEVRRDAQNRARDFRRSRTKYNEEVGLPFLMSKIDAETGGNIQLEQAREGIARRLQQQEASDALRLQDVVNAGRLEERGLANQGMLRNTGLAGTFDMQRARESQLGDIMKSLIGAGYDPKSIQAAFDARRPAPTLRGVMSGAGGYPGGYADIAGQSGARINESYPPRVSEGGAGYAEGMGVDLSRVRPGVLSRMKSAGGSGLRRDQVYKQMGEIAEKMIEVGQEGYAPEEEIRINRVLGERYRYLKSLLEGAGADTGEGAPGGAGRSEDNEPWRKYDR